MELFQKIGPRVILIEYHGKLSGLVTVKDCLKYQFKVEAAENPKDDQHVVEGQEHLWSALRRVGFWVSNSVSTVSRGHVRLSGQFDDERARGRRGNILDGDEEGVDEGVELERR